MSSPLQWETFPLPPGAALKGITFYRNDLIVVGELGRILSTADGRNWVTLSCGQYFDLHGVTSTTDRCVAVGSGGSICFQPGEANTFSVDYHKAVLRAVAFHGGRFVAVGEAMSMGMDAVVLSTDGGTGWQQCTPSAPLSNFFSVVHGNGRFVAIGAQIAVSEDGVKWVPHLQSLKALPGLYSLAFGNGLFVGVGERGCIATSVDGVSWTPCASGTTSRLLAVAHGNGKFVGVGEGGTVVVSSDAVTWHTYSVGGEVLVGVVYGRGMAAALGRDHVKIFRP